MFKVCLATPCQDQVSAGYALDLARLVAFTTTAPPEITIAIAQVRGTILPQSRATLVRVATAQQATHICWLDADMRFPQDTVARLLAHEEPIVGANYTRRRHPMLPTAEHESHGHCFTPTDATGLDEVTQLGMGVLLVDMSVFERIPQPWFAFGFSPRTNAYSGEDVFFCRQARRAGYHLMVDHDLSKQVRHVGELEWTHEHALLTREHMQPSEERPDTIERTLALVSDLSSNGRPVLTGDAHGP